MIKIMFRRDHDYEWERTNPILRDSELVVVYTALGPRYKQGDGKKHFKDLQYVTDISSLKLVKVYDSGNAEAGALLNFIPESDFYTKTRDPYRVYTK